MALLTNEAATNREDEQEREEEPERTVGDQSPRVIEKGNHADQRSAKILSSGPGLSAVGVNRTSSRLCTNSVM